MNTNSVKESVVSSYGKLAKSSQLGVFSKLFACCNPKAKAQEVGQIIGYSNEELDAVPEGSNLGVGCGNPSSIVNLNEGDTVVDLGAGAGFDAFIIAPLVGQQGKVIGVDLSEDMVQLAKKNADKGDFENVEFLMGDIEQLPLESNLADAVVSNCVINLSLNKQDVFNEAYRVLKPGGKLAISDVILNKELPQFVKDSLEGHIACVSGAEKLEDYLDYIKQAGFKDIKIETKSNFPIELMLNDPQVLQVAQLMSFDLNSLAAADIASSVSSVSISAIK